MTELKLNIEGSSYVELLMNKTKEELVALFLETRANLKTREAESEWLDKLADSLRDGDEEKEQEAHELYKDFKRIRKEEREKMNQYFYTNFFVEPLELEDGTRDTIYLIEGFEFADGVTESQYVITLRENGHEVECFSMKEDACNWVKRELDKK